MLMGLATPAESWGPLPGILARQGYQVIVVDNRDCGKSGECAEGYTMADMADDAVAILDSLSIQSTYVLGISMGGFIAQELVLNHPERVERLLLVSTGPGIGGGVAADESFLMEIFVGISGDPVEAQRKVVRLLVGSEFHESAEELLEVAATHRSVNSQTPAGFLRQLQAVVEFSSWERLHEIKVPVLLLHGDADPLVPVGNGINLAERIEGAELRIYEGAGHLLPLERPAEVIASLVDFLPVTQGAN